MAWVTPTNVSTGDVLTAAKWNQDVVENWNALGGAWTSFTPSLTGFGTLSITQGNSTVSGSYIKVGRYVRFWAKWTFGSTTSFSGAAAPMVCSLPVTAANSQAAAAGVVCTVVDNGSAHYQFMTLNSDSTTTAVLVGPIVTSGTYGSQGNVSGTVPFTWAVNDVVWWAGTYEAAS